jgi:hypothetical protein
MVRVLGGQHEHEVIFDSNDAWRAHARNVSGLFDRARIHRDHIPNFIDGEADEFVCATPDNHQVLMRGQRRFRGEFGA